MIFERTRYFRRAAKKLGAQDRASPAKALLLYEANPAHPSLHIKRIQGTKSVWEGRVSDTIRFTFEKIEGGIVLRNVGVHDPTLRRP